MSWKESCLFFYRHIYNVYVYDVMLYKGFVSLLDLMIMCTIGNLMYDECFCLG